MNYVKWLYDSRTRESERLKARAVAKRREAEEGSAKRRSGSMRLLQSRRAMLGKSDILVPDPWTAFGDPLKTKRQRLCQERKVAFTFGRQDPILVSLGSVPT